MTKGQRTIAALLGAVGVLLALNLMTRGVTATPAPQEEGGTTGACCLPSGSCVLRNETDCLAIGGVFGGQASNCADTFCPPPPTAVSITVTPQFDVNGDPQNTFSVVRLWTDGAVDMTRVGVGSCGSPPVPCSGPDQIIPAPCPEDITADGSVNVLDLIDLLLAFGTACP